MNKKVKRGKNVKKDRANTVKPVREGFRAVAGKNGGTIWLSKKGYTGNPDGRPRKYVSTLAKSMGYSQTEVKDCMEAILGASEVELKSIANNKHGSALERTLAKAILKGVKNGTLGNLESIITRSFGYPNKSIDVKNTGDRPLATLNVTVVKNEGTPKLSSTEDQVDTKKKFK